VKGLFLLKSEYVLCEGCSLGKHHQVDFSKESERNENEVLELLHNGLCWSTQTKFLGGFFLFYDIYWWYKKIHLGLLLQIKELCIWNF